MLVRRFSAGVLTAGPPMRQATAAASLQDEPELGGEVGKPHTPSVCLAGGPEKREYPSQLGIHLRNPGLGRCRTKVIDGPGRHHDFRTRARGAVSRRVYFGDRRRIGADLSQPSDHARGAVPARRRDRCDRAHHAGQHVAIARPADRHRKHRRRRRHDRRRPRRPRRARRLYGAAASGGAGGGHDALPESRVRRRKGFRHHRPHQHRRFDRCGAPDAAAEQYRPSWCAG